MSIQRLLLETSSRTPLVALATDDHVVCLRRLSEQRRNARDLIPTVAEVLAFAGLAPPQLGGIIVGLGPGSYTGLRGGIMAAKTLAYALGCPLVGVPTFHTLAGQVNADIVEVIADAQKDAVYAQTFDHGRPITELTILSLTDWLARLNPAAVVTGPGLAKVTANVCRAAEATESLSPHSLLSVGLRLTAADPFTLGPMYLRPSAAEQQWEARGL